MSLWYTKAEPFYDWLEFESSLQFPVLDNFANSGSLPVLQNSSVCSNYQQQLVCKQQVSNSYIAPPPPLFQSIPDSLYTAQQDFYNPLYEEQKYSPVSPDLLCQQEHLYPSAAAPLYNIGYCEEQAPSASPKDEDILKLLEEIQPDELEQLIRERVTDFNDSDLSICNDDFSDYLSNSPQLSSDSSMDDPVSSPCSTSSSASQVVPSGFKQKASTTKRKRGARPYARANNEDKKVRKKEQNKNAATRYRMKKKAEIEEMLSEEKVLADKNGELRGQLEELTREIKYLKSLMRDVYKAKGLIK